jgi:hypothetical protein
MLKKLRHRKLKMTVRQCHPRTNWESFVVLCVKLRTLLSQSSNSLHECSNSRAIRSAGTYSDRPKYDLSLSPLLFDHAWKQVSWMAEEGWCVQFIRRFVQKFLPQSSNNWEVHAQFRSKFRAKYHDRTQILGGGPLRRTFSPKNLGWNFDTTSTCLPRFLITEYFSVEKTQYRFLFIASYLPLPEQYRRDGSLLDRTLSPKFDHWDWFRRTFSPITNW